MGAHDEGEAERVRRLLGYPGNSRNLDLRNALRSDESNSDFNLLIKLNALANFRIGVKSHEIAADHKGWSLDNGVDRPLTEGGAMARRKLNPKEIVERLQMIDALTAEGLPISQALSSAGVLDVEYDRWRIEYDGLQRTLGPLLHASPKGSKRARRSANGRPVKAPK